jgi:hypothetical protein
MKHTGLLYSILFSIFLSQFPLHGQAVTAEISFGELVDKITILTIKTQRINDAEKLRNIWNELESLQDTFNNFIGSRQDIEHLQELLQKINEALWDIEDEIRIKERDKEFDNEFITLARNVYVTNDKRCAIKKQIDALLGSRITEEKSYAKLTHE